jgi:V8-like Glu-specific endopeptidase
MEILMLAGRAAYLAITVFLASVVSAHAQGEHPDDFVQGKIFREDEQKAVTEFWTMDRMKQAQPLPMPQIVPPDREQPQDQSLRTRSHFQTYRNRSLRSGESESPVEEIIASASMADVTKPPFSFGGKLFFTKGDRSHYCTGEYVGDASVVLTASHCIIDRVTGSLNSNFLFVQAYAAGPGHLRSIACVLASPNWFGAANQWERIHYDYAFLKTQQASSGRMRLKINWSYTDAASIGYPFAITGGESMQQVFGLIGKVPVGPAVYGMRVYEPNFTEGVSGGSWIAELTEGSATIGNYAISVNSSYYRDPNDLGILWVYGPYFDSLTSSLFQRVRRGCR